MDVRVTTGDNGELLQFGPTTIRIVEDGSGAENRISAIASGCLLHRLGKDGRLQQVCIGGGDEAFLVTSGTLRCIGWMNGQRDAKTRVTRFAALAATVREFAERCIRSC